MLAANATWGATMTTIHRGRRTARPDVPVVVFAIGMRINELWAVHRWLRPTLDTVRMWWHVQRHHPEGYLSGYLFVYARGVGMMQYWRDFESLEAMAHDDSQPHLQAWRRLAAQTRTSKTFGYWHETYRVEPGTSETIYGSMPAFGLAAATTHEPIGAATERAAARLG